jgi:F0F1-type ATP synthase assembly protein I
MGFLGMPREEIVDKVHKQSIKILATLILLIVAAAELYIIGFPEWQSYLLAALTIPIIIVLIYYRK